MAPATAIADGKGQRAFADCRRQKQTGNEIPTKSYKINKFDDLKSKKDVHKTIYSLNDTKNVFLNVTKLLFQMKLNLFFFK